MVGTILRSHILRLLTILVSIALPTSSIAASLLEEVVDDLMREARRQVPSDRIPPNRPDRRVLASELAKSDVSRVQLALRELGHYDGRIDGDPGPATFGALGRWAAAHGWEAPATLRPAHLDALETEVASMRGVRSSAARGTFPEAEIVKRAQSALIVLGYLTGAETGEVDPPTMDAMARWARDRGWSAPDAVRIAHAENMEREIEVRGLATADARPPAVDPSVVRRVQEGLVALGYLKGGADGQTNDTTMEAMARWAVDRGWAPPSTIRAAHAEHIEAEVAGDNRRDDKLATLAAWQPDDTLDRHGSRLRDAVRSKGGDCAAEQRVMESTASSLDWSWSEDGAAQVGSTSYLSWKMAREAERLPMWLVVSSDVQLRFSGKGHLALGPDAPNPFNLEAGRGRTRAMVPLHASEAGREGRIGWQSLQAGRATLTIEVIGYLRACAKEVLLRHVERSLEIEPAPATIVLDTPTGRALYGREVDLPAQGRRMMLNEKGILILDAATDTEVARHGGLEPTLSPTHRFATLRQGETINVVDVLDGEIVATLPYGLEAYWALGDSVIFTTRAPWATVSLESTFGDMISVDDITTGPACCTAGSDGETRVAIDVTNAAFLVEGSHGTLAGSLIDPPPLDESAKADGYMGGGPKDGRKKLLALLGRSGVAPFPEGGSGNDVAGGMIQTVRYDDYNGWDEGDRIAKPFAAALDLVLERVGLQSRETARAQLMGGKTEGLSFQLDRLGLALRDMTAGERLYFGSGGMSHAGTASSRLSSSESVMKRFEREAKAVGWRFGWALPEEDEALADCEHVVPEPSLENPLALRDAVEVHRVAVASGPLWLARAECTAGATYGSLRNYHSLYLTDLSRQAAAKPRIVKFGGAFVSANNQRSDWWYQHPFATKADDDYLLIYAPSEGVIAVFDRAAGRMVWIGEDLPDGNLLTDAFLTADGRHAVQLNADGSFRIHALADGRQVVAGRLVEDEVAVWTSDYHYDATAEAAALIDIRFPGEPGVFSLDRFGSARAAPGLLADALAGGAELGGAPLAVPPDLSGTMELSRNGRLIGRLAFDRAKVRTVSIFQDGILTDSFDAATLNDGTLDVARLPGARWATALASDENGLASRPVTADLGGSEGTGTKRFLAIGINDYGDDLGGLDFPLRDAGTLMQLFARPGTDGASAYAQAGLKNEDATPDAIRTAVARTLDGLSRSDRAIFFFAGHGLQSDGRLYLATSATDPRDLPKTALPFDDLLALMAKSPARITVLLDACHSGLAGQQLFATNDQLAQRLEALPSHVTIIAAAKGRQTSGGSTAAGGGYFTQSLATVIGAERDRYDMDGNGAIEADELLTGLRQLVAAASGGRQSPWIVRSRMVGPYALF